MSAPKKAAEAHAAPAKKAEEGAAPEKKKGGGKLLIGAFVSAVIIAETGVFFFLVPSGEEVAALAESRLIEAAEAKGLTKSDSHEEEHKVIEFDLGSYPLVFVPSGSDRNHRVEFRLFGTLLAKDEARMKELFEEKKFRFRHRLLLEIRNSSLDELNENQLGLIQRRILATSTELLGEAILLSVGFQDYQVLEE
ncbi:MAG: dihydrolipoamide acetyltransferase [Pirellulaceae bacterium]|nr:dihydrolipoamide acetyltransferase [Pirellulaceae bacterium]